MSNSYKPGQSIRFSASVSSLGALFDPDALVLSINQRMGTGTIAATTPVKDSTGNYHVDVVIPMGAAPGIWVGRWVATGAAVNSNGLEEIVFSIVPLLF